MILRNTILSTAGAVSVLSAVVAAAAGVPTSSIGVVRSAMFAVAPTTNGDLVYVPITPCRIVDTRADFGGGSGPLAMGSTTQYHAVAASFAAQGGDTGNCGIPAGVGAIAVTFGMINATAKGDIRAWPTGQPMPNASIGVFNYAATGADAALPGKATLSGGSAIIPVCTSACPTTGEFQILAESASLNLTIDVTGYFHTATPLVNGLGQGLNWGTIARNTIGNATAQLRNDGSAPLGSGSLQLTVGAGTDKIEFGNEVDFAGQLVSALTAVGYEVKTTGENSGIASANMPSIAIEINPNDGHSSYTTLNYSPNSNTVGGVWAYVDAFADTSNAWGLTGSYYNADPTRCGINGSRCNLGNIQTMLPNATILSIAIGKGRDHAWNGQVDSLRINGTTYDFEFGGVRSIATL